MAKKCFDFAREAKHRITIEQNNGTSDDYGGTSDSWDGVGDNSGVVWAAVRPASDFTRVQSDQVQSRITHVFIVRYQSALADIKETAAYRITLDSRVYDIRAVKNMDDELKDYGKAYQILLADEAGPDV